MAKKAQNGSPLGSILGVVFGALSDFWQFFRQLDFQSVFGRLLGSILEDFGQFLNTFLGFLGPLFRSVRRSEKCESSTWAFADTGRKRRDIGEFLATSLGWHCERHFGTFESPCWLHLRTVLGPKWPKKAI